MHPGYEFTANSLFLKMAMQITYPLFEAITVQTQAAKAFFPQFIVDRVYVIEKLGFSSAREI
jgi:hypothetical protein